MVTYSWRRMVNRDLELLEAMFTPRLVDKTPPNYPNKSPYLTSSQAVYAASKTTRPGFFIHVSYHRPLPLDLPKVVFFYLL
jgi:hypothetical protein